MPSSFRSATLALTIALGACASQPPAPRSCESSAECPPDARCLAASCVANAAPLPAIALPAAALRANVLLTFDGSGSADPDPGDSVVAYGWAFRAIAASCPPPQVASAEPLANVRFACAGRYAADLTVTDQLARSATRTEEFEVAPLDGPALVTVSADLAVDHACTTLPTRCTPSGEVTLSASAPTVDSPDLAFEWTVEPPSNRPLDAGRRVVFTPSAGVAAPSISIETDGQAISGDWIFRVEARDGAGIVGVAATRVSILNRPPVIQKTLPVPDHAFDGERFTASGEIPFTMTDPDGDQLFGPALAWHHVGDGGATFSGTLLGDPTRLVFSIAVPYAAPDDALLLIGGEGLERSVTFEVSDVNGAITPEVWPIVVANRPPVLVSPAAPRTVDHAFDAVAGTYVATAPLSTWSDPDGDPLVQSPGSGTGDPSCAVVTVDGGSGPRLAHARCTLAFVGMPAVANFAGLHTVTQAIQDPWTSASASSTASFTIGNRAPSTDAAAGTHVVDEYCGARAGCCVGIAGECSRYFYPAPAGTAVVPSRWSDPDGDPLSIEVPAVDGVVPVQPLVCTPEKCDLVLSVPQVSVCGVETTVLEVTVTDGLVTSPKEPLEIARDCPG
jgi:hypothetical protein